MERGAAVDGEGVADLIEVSERLGLMSQAREAPGMAGPRLGRWVTVAVAAGTAVAATITVKNLVAPGCVSDPMFKDDDTPSLVSLEETYAQSLDGVHEDQDGMAEYLALQAQVAAVAEESARSITSKEEANRVNKVLNAALKDDDHEEAQRLLRRAMNRAVRRNEKERGMVKEFLMKRQLEQQGNTPKLLDFLGKNKKGKDQPHHWGPPPKPPPKKDDHKKDDHKKNDHKKHEEKKKPIGWMFKPHAEEKKENPPPGKKREPITEKNNAALLFGPHANMWGPLKTATPAPDEKPKTTTKRAWPPPISGDPMVMPFSLGIRGVNSKNQDGTRGIGGRFDPNQAGKENQISFLGQMMGQNQTESEESSSNSQFLANYLWRGPQQQAAVASCVFNVLSVANTVAFGAANFNDAYKTCGGIKFNELIRSQRIKAKVCAFNTFAVIGAFATMGSSISLASDNCAATLIPNVRAVCSGAIIGLITALAQAGGSMTLINAACRRVGWYNRIPPGLTPSNIGSNDMPPIRRLEEEEEEEEFVVNEDLAANATLAGEVLQAARNAFIESVPELKKAKVQAQLLETTAEMMKGMIPDAEAETAADADEVEELIDVLTGDQGLITEGVLGEEEVSFDSVESEPTSAPEATSASESTPEEFSAAANASAPARKLLFGGGKGSVATQCALEITSIMWNMASMGLAINSAANPNNGASCPPKNIQGETLPADDRGGYIYHINQAFCAVDIGGILTAFGTAVAQAFLASFMCIDFLNVVAICGAGITGVMTAMAGIVQVGAGINLACDEFNRPIILKAVDLVTKIDDATGGAITALIASSGGSDSGADSEFGNFGRRLGDFGRRLTIEDKQKIAAGAQKVKDAMSPEEMRDLMMFEDADMIRELEERFGNPENVWLALGYNLTDKDAEWRKPENRLPPPSADRVIDLIQEPPAPISGAFGSTCSK